MGVTAIISERRPSQIRLDNSNGRLIASTGQSALRDLGCCLTAAARSAPVRPLEPASEPRFRASSSMSSAASLALMGESLEVRSPAPTSNAESKLGVLAGGCDTPAPRHLNRGRLLRPTGSLWHIIRGSTESLLRVSALPTSQR